MLQVCLCFIYCIRFLIVILSNCIVSYSNFTVYHLNYTLEDSNITDTTRCHLDLSLMLLQYPCEDHLFRMFEVPQ